MKSRRMFVFAMLVMSAVGIAAAATQQPVVNTSTTTPALTTEIAASDPYVAASPINATAPAERVPCSAFSSQCSRTGQHCGPVPGPCRCFVDEFGTICYRT
ncbi:MAG: hypothetical protein ACREAA_10195 [Candidatus Polarisedimenticolia bacterium]